MRRDLIIFREGGIHPIAIRYVRHRQLHQISGFTTSIKSDKVLLETLIGGPLLQMAFENFWTVSAKTASILRTLCRHEICVYFSCVFTFLLMYLCISVCLS